MYLQVNKLNAQFILNKFRLTVLSLWSLKIELTHTTY